MSAAATYGYYEGEQEGVEKLRQDSDHRLDLFASAIEGLIRRSEYVPSTIQLNPEILALLRHPDSPDRIAAASTYLRRLNAHVGSLAAFTLDSRGVVVASSNATYPDDSLLGSDVSFRPYFLEALSGRVGRHFAIGVNGKIPGYFVSHPIRDGAQVVGVATIKIGLESVGQMWDLVGAPALLADTNRIVIDSSQPAWRYTALNRLTLDQRVDIQLTRLYDYLQIPEFPLKLNLDPLRNYQRIGERLVLGRNLDGMDWRLILFLDEKEVRREPFGRATASAVAATLVILMLLVLFQAHRIQRQRKEARRILENANTELEFKVEERTYALTHANARLSREVVEREHAEQSLRATQDELVQAAKMAVLGQLAAGITHELAQPLGAIRTLSGNAEEFLRRGALDPLAGNLQRIGRLSDQMGSIIQPLKAFARKSASAPERTHVGQTVGNALFLYGQRIRKSQIRVDDRCSAESIYAWCNANRLEQVLINLVGNALDALAGVADPVLSISAGYFDEAGAQWAWVDIEDNGVGFSPEARKQIFEPFFTTKTPGAGLGLGLVISRDIVRGFGGEILVFHLPAGGTRFRLHLPHRV